MLLENLDNVDRKILAQLDKNARTSYSELGKRIRIPKETVKYRISLLQKKGIIKGFYTAVDFSKLGFTVYRLYFRFQNADPKTEEKIISYIANSQNVAVAYRTNGPYHLAIGFWARDQWEAESFWLDLKKKFGEYFGVHHLSVMTDYLEFSRPYLFPSQKEEKEAFTTISKSKSEKLDALDFKLLGFISNNARASLVEMSKHLGISVVTVRYRLKNLISRKVITGFRPIFNLQELGIEYYKVDLFLRTQENLEAIKQAVFSHPNVIYSERTLITGDLEFDMEIQNFDEFTKAMDSIRAKFPEDIKEYNYYSLVKNYKTSYVPSFNL